MKQMITGFVAIALGGAALALTLKHKPVKIGIVDNAMMMTQFSEAVAAEKELQAIEEGWKANIKTLQDSVQAAMNTLSKDYPTAKEAERKRMGENLQRWNAEYSRYQGAVAGLRAEKQKSLLNPVLEKVNAFVKNWAREHNYDVVLGTGNGGVVLSVAEAQNITAAILQDMNKLYAGREAPATAKPATADSAASPVKDSAAAGAAK